MITLVRLWSPVVDAIVGFTVSAVMVSTAVATALLNKLLATNVMFVSVGAKGPVVNVNAVALGTSVLPWNHWNLFGSAPLIPLTVKLAVVFSAIVRVAGVMLAIAIGPVGKVKYTFVAVSVLGGTLTSPASRTAIVNPSPPMPSL